MSITLETKTLSRMIDSAKDIDRLWELGLRPEVFEDPIHRALFEWVIRYWQDNSMTAAPTWVVVEYEFPSIAPKLERKVDESIEWLVNALKERYVLNEAQEILREANREVNADPIEVMRRLWQRSYDLTEATTARSSRVDMAQNYEQRRRELVHHRQVGGTGVPYGLAEVDAHTGGLRTGELAAVAAFTKVGKAQPLTARVATPAGWTTMGELSVGDEILGADGLTQKVIAVHERGLREVWEVRTGQGVTIEACAEHLWSVIDKKNRRRPVVMTTEEISRTIRWGKDNRLRFDLPLPAPVQYQDQEPPLLDPYTLGLLLGDGGLTKGVVFTNPDLGLHQAMRFPEGTRVRTITDRGCPHSAITGSFQGARNPVIDELRSLGLYGLKSVGKFIPESYKRSPVADRLALLRGLMDTDGSCENGGKMSLFNTSSARLAADVAELVQSLGGTSGITIKEEPKHQNGVGQPSYRVIVRLPGGQIPFLNAADKIERFQAHRGRREPTNRIVEVRRTSRREAMRCITVSNEDCLYLTDGHTLTHNSWTLCHTAIQAHLAGFKPVLFTLEMTTKEMAHRIDAFASGVGYDMISDGNVFGDDLRRLHESQEALRDRGSLHVERPERGERTVKYMVNRARQLGADIMMIDQLSFMDSELDYKGDQALRHKHGEIMFDLKDEISRDSAGAIPCMLAVQLNRDSQRGDGGRGQMHQFANSSFIEQTVDIAFGLWRNENMRQNNAMGFDIMGSRRGDKRSWLLEWRLSGRTAISVRGENEDE